MILDLHVHSCFSYDSLAKPAEIIRAARRKGLNGIAVTDHDTIAGGLEVLQASDGQLVVIVGAEICTDAGDIIGLFLREEIESRHGLDVVDEIHRQGGIAVLPHPFKAHYLSPELIEAIDVIEAFNARCNPEENRKAANLALLHHKPIVTGSDAHTCREIGMARVLLRSNNVRQGILACGHELEGRYTPSYLVSVSQLIKSVKMARYREAPHRSLSVAVRFLRLRQSRGKTGSG